MERERRGALPSPQLSCVLREARGRRTRDRPAAADAGRVRAPVPLRGFSGRGRVRRAERRGAATARAATTGRQHVQPHVRGRAVPAGGRGAGGALAVDLRGQRARGPRAAALQEPTHHQQLPDRQPSAQRPPALAHCAALLDRERPARPLGVRSRTLQSLACPVCCPLIFLLFVY